MENKQVKTEVKVESIPRDIARILRFIGVSADVVSLRIAGVPIFASGVLAFVYCNQTAIIVLASIYSLCAAVILILAHQIETCYNVEYSGPCGRSVDIK